MMMNKPIKPLAESTEEQARWEHTGLRRRMILGMFEEDLEDELARHLPADRREAWGVADMSSNILSRKIDVSQYGVIYAGAQKNIGPAGICIAIVRDDLLELANEVLPSILNYKVLAEKDSMFNTPPTYAWYLSGLVFKWLKAQGGVEAMEGVNQEKAALLYNAIDDSDFYKNDVHTANRSRMNVPFQLAKPELDAKFLELADAAGLKSLKGHRAVGGMRASLYNAMSLEGVQTLVSFMKDFEEKYA